MRFMVGYKYPCFQYVVNKDRDNCLGKKYTFFLKKKIQKINLKGLSSDLFILKSIHFSIFNYLGVINSMHINIDSNKTTLSVSFKRGFKTSEYSQRKYNFLF